MLKILRTDDGTSVVFVLCGRIEAEHLAELRALVNAETHIVALDLKDVTLVDRDTIGFLAGCAENGIEVRNCPAYIRHWMATEDRR